MADPKSIDINWNAPALSVLRPDDKRGEQDTRTPAIQARDQQQGAQFMQSGMQGRSTDPDYINRLERFEGVPHAEIYQHAQEMNPGAMHTLADSWIKMSTEISGGLMGMHMSIQKELAQGIDGQMADAALAAAQKFYTQAHDVQDVIASCGHRVKAAAHAAEVVKMTVPPPAGPLHSGDVPDVIQGMQVAIAAQISGIASDSDSIDVAYKKGAEALRQAAVDAMNNHYKPSYPPAGAGIPTFVPVSAPGDGGNDNTNSGGNNPGINRPGTMGDGTNTTGPGKDENPSGTTESSDSGNPADSPRTDPSAAAADGGAQNPAGSRLPDATSAASATGTRPAGFEAAGSGYSPGTGFSSGFGRPGSASGVGGRGGSIAGMLGSTTSPTSPIGAAAAASGRPGMSGMPGMGGAGAKRSDDAEREHKTPDYLIMDREEELIGPIDPAAPGAIGGDVPAAQPAPGTGSGPR
ncbi:hypothetical protein C5E45_21430 [Nocardia nova]|uniref:PPE domain-containing protein n=1 Tax=Nocardia nova TaxID=37330 RepID=A0A2S6AM32_9NOCA|nr:hypothetical protein [Nocardia nova]PPJ32636.1 hypothetical protein C5E41_05920 [Nocardia nova]PPJ36278.1 hypothetical protein C5E45_21430 [Nocardia nova]